MSVESELVAVPRAVLLVEGLSDQVALEALARRRGRDLQREGVLIVAMGGAQAIGRFLDLFGARRADVKLAGICDAGEEPYFHRALERAGVGSGLARADMEALGFYVCESNLEDELIRALGVADVLKVIEAEGELAALRTYQKQPAQRGKTADEQLLGFMWNRKARYAQLLVDALDLERVPRPLDAVLAHV